MRNSRWSIIFITLLVIGILFYGNKEEPMEDSNEVRIAQEQENVVVTLNEKVKKEYDDNVIEDASAKTTTQIVYSNDVKSQVEDTVDQISVVTKEKSQVVTNTIVEKELAELPTQVDDKIQYSVLMERYESRFEVLKADFLNQIDGLLLKAKEEYISESDNDLSFKLKFTAKYIKEGNILEAQCDDQFSLILEDMKQEMYDNNYSFKGVKEAEMQYKSEKIAKKIELTGLGNKIVYHESEGE